MSRERDMRVLWKRPKPYVATSFVQVPVVMESPLLLVVGHGYEEISMAKMSQIVFFISSPSPPPPNNPLFFLTIPSFIFILHILSSLTSKVVMGASWI